MTPVETIAAQWEEFRQSVMVLDGTETREDLAAWRALFYGGARAVVRLLQHAPDPDAVFVALDDELDRFGQEALRTGEIPE